MQVSEAPGELPGLVNFVHVAACNLCRLPRTMAQLQPWHLVVALAGAFALVFYSVHPPATLEISRPSSPVYLRHSATGAFISISPTDGLLHARNTTTKPTRFRLVSISSAMVENLRRESYAFERAKLRSGLGGIKSRTRSNCTCSGFSNEHGFGRYCYSWEDQWQEPWCYVNETCASSQPVVQFGGKRGSFGRRFEKCTPAPPPPSPPNPPPPPNPPFPSPPPPPKPRYAPGSVFVAPPGCKCTGYSNKHGFGASCAAWEAKVEGGQDQTPWCYVDDACPTALGKGRRRGSFGKLYAECVFLRGPDRPAARASAKPAAEPAKSGLFGFFGRRLSASPEHGPSKPAKPAKPIGGRAARIAAHRRMWTSARPHPSPNTPCGPTHSSTPPTLPHAPHPIAVELGRDENLMAKLERFRARYVAFLTEDHAYLSVERPPHAHALRPHALSNTLALQSVFALVRPPSRARGGRETLLISLGVTAYLTLCPDPAAPADSNVEGATLCTGFKEKKGDQPLKLLRKPSVPSAPALFSLVDVSRAGSLK